MNNYNFKLNVSKEGEFMYTFTTKDKVDYFCDFCRPQKLYSKLPYLEKYSLFDFDFKIQEKGMHADPFIKNTILNIMSDYTINTKFNIMFLPLNIDSHNHNSRIRLFEKWLYESRFKDLYKFEIIELENTGDFSFLILINPK